MAALKQKGPLDLYYKIMPKQLSISPDPKLSFLMYLPSTLLHMHAHHKLDNS